jgi:hypothetical protein
MLPDPTNGKVSVACGAVAVGAMYIDGIFVAEHLRRTGISRATG